MAKAQEHVLLWCQRGHHLARLWENEVKFGANFCTYCTLVQKDHTVFPNMLVLDRGYHADVYSAYNLGGLEAAHTLFKTKFAETLAVGGVE